MRPLIFVIAALSTWGSALAVDPDALRLGAAPALAECLGGAVPACEQAAELLEDRGMAAWLRRQEPTGLGDADRRTFLALDCASDDGRSCTALADDVQPADPLRAAMLYARGCSLGDQGGCQAIDVPSLFSPDAAYHLLAGGASWASTKPVYARPTDVDELTRLGKGCAADTWPGACFDLGGAVWRTLGDPSARAQNLMALGSACAAHVEPACRLEEDVRGSDQTAIPGAGNTTELLHRICMVEEVGRACELEANLLELGRASPFGTSASRNAQQNACNFERTPGCERVTRAYRTPLAADLGATCDAVRSGAGGDPHACLEVSVMLRYGVGLPKDEDAAAQRMRDACTAGDGPACASLGDSVAPAKLLEGLSWWDKACENGMWAYCGGAMSWRLSGAHGAPVDPVRAVRDLTAGCEHGASNACGQLAVAKENALGTPEDAASAYSLYVTSCALGSMYGCGGLGWALAEGYATARDMSTALPLLLHACREGEATTCAYLGQLYEKGLGLAVDLPRARTAYQVACTAGVADACTSLDGIGRTPTAPLASMPLPSLRGPGPYGGGARTYGPTLGGPPAQVVEVAKPERATRARHRSSGKAPDGMNVWLAFGTQRSWTLQNQAPPLRLGLGYTRGLFGIGGDLDWISDHRWQSKAKQQYFRIAVNVDLWLRVPTSSALDILLGAGGGVGGYRPGAGSSNPLTLTENTHEFLQFNFHVRPLFIGVRVEQAQWFQKVDGLSLDHTTGVYGLIGVTGGR